MTTNTHENSSANEQESALLRILVVDDEQPMQALASTILDRLGHSAITAGSGEEAIETYRREFEIGTPFDLVVMDLALPGGISGLEATIAIKQINAKAKVIVSSGYLEQNARSAALDHGFAGILPKPYTAERLSSELRWVTKNQSEAEAAAAANSDSPQGHHVQPDTQSQSAHFHTQQTNPESTETAQASQQQPQPTGFHPPSNQ